ncbi:MAG TPA: hypothetical protein DEF48_20450 [Nostoc sp. UBA8866]|nr:asl4039 [Nostoc sp. PCC 7120 = FACHB-418]HBW32399.1 hypothetical protein [Nostoc sp. UBA8866]
MKSSSSAFIKQRIYSNKDGVKTFNFHEKNIIDTNHKYVICATFKGFTNCLYFSETFLIEYVYTITKLLLEPVGGLL